MRIAASASGAAACGESPRALRDPTRARNLRFAAPAAAAPRPKPGQPQSASARAQKRMRKHAGVYACVCAEQREAGRKKGEARGGGDTTTTNKQTNKQTNKPRCDAAHTHIHTHTNPHKACLEAALLQKRGLPARSSIRISAPAAAPAAAIDVAPGGHIPQLLRLSRRGQEKVAGRPSRRGPSR
jgi:hypothetical protein